MTPTVRVSVMLPPEAESVARSIAQRRGISLSATFRLALGVLQLHEEARREGSYVGTARDREKLDQVIIAPL